MLELPIAKGETPLLKDRPKTILPEWVEYIETDVNILKMAISLLYFTEGFEKFTTASEALKEFKDTQNFRKKFPLLEKEVDGYLRRAYRGGVAQVNPKHEGKIINQPIEVYDINSMYPAVMLNNPMPIGEPKLFKGEPPLLDEQHFIVARVSANLELKPEHLPTIQSKELAVVSQLGIKSTDYIRSTNDTFQEFYLTNFDLLLLKKHYDYELVFHDYYEFKTERCIFDAYINKFRYMKENPKSPVERLRAKLMLNSLYGKFGSKVEVIGKETYLEDGILKFRELPPEETEPNYIPIALFTTSIARYGLFNSIQDNFQSFIYCDTDSMHLLKQSDIHLDIHPSRFGAWKLENLFKRGKYIRAKCYIEQRYTEPEISTIPEHAEFYKSNINKPYMFDGSLDVVGAGMTPTVKEQVTFDNFNIGQTYKTKKSKQTKGGVVIYETEFQLRAKTTLF